MRAQHYCVCATSGSGNLHTATESGFHRVVLKVATYRAPNELLNINYYFNHAEFSLFIVETSLERTLTIGKIMSVLGKW